MKYCNKDQEVAIIFSFSNEDKVSEAVSSTTDSSKNVKGLDFASCSYNKYWWTLKYWISFQQGQSYFLEGASLVLLGHILLMVSPKKHKA